jgi:aryl-alcohol dehydrogenase-like predicted oxidoreductase
MEYRTLGHSRLNVSALSLGSWNTFELMPEGDALQVMTEAVAAGVNFLDDARYDDTSGKAPIKTGYSEVVFGNLLRAGAFTRDSLIIANRLWFEFHPEESLEAEIDGSLGRIGIDQFDLVFCYTVPESLRPVELVAQMADLVASGKIRYWGPANWPVELLAQCCEIANRTGAPLPTAAMVPYSLLNRTYVENDAMLAVCQQYDIGIVASFGLQGGVLTGKYNRPYPVTLRRDAAQIEALRADGTLAKTASFVALADEAGFPPTQLALAYCLKHPQVKSLLFGATSVTQLEENLGALDLVAALDDNLYARLREIF